MECRNSPVAKTPPSDLPDIPGVTSPIVEELKIENNHVQNYDEKANVGGYTRTSECAKFPRNTEAYIHGARRSL